MTIPVNTNNNRASLYKKIAKVMSKVERVPKNGYNSFHKYKFVQESDLVDHARKFMVEEGLILLNSIREYEINGDIAIATIDYTLCDTETGESITSSIVAEGQDKGDKKFPKAMASGTKYFLMKTFLIPTGDDPEADTSTDQRAYGDQYSNNQKPQDNVQSASTKAKKSATQKQIGLIKGRMREILSFNEGQSEEDLLERMKEKITQFESLENLTMQQASTIIATLKEWKDRYENKRGE